MFNFSTSVSLQQRQNSGPQLPASFHQTTSSSSFPSSATHLGAGLLGSLATANTLASINPNATQSSNRIWIGGLPRHFDTDEIKSELRKVYGEFGRVTDICIITNARDVMSFVQYTNSEDATAAVEATNGELVMGNKVSQSWKRFIIFR
jgi:hypothetical protein